MMILDELPNDLGFQDEDIFRVAVRSFKLHLSLHEQIDEAFTQIKEEFESLTKDIKKEDISELSLLQFQIPMTVLHLSILVENIKANQEEENKKDEIDEDKEDTQDRELFPGFPKFEDWWIQELWVNHQAYFGLYKWKKIVSSLCNSSDQQRAWEIIFANWINIKKQISSKGQLGFEYNYAFDTLMRDYCGLEEELSSVSLESMEKLIDHLTQKENFSKLASLNEHQLLTTYTKFKREKIDYKDLKGK